MAFTELPQYETDPASAPLLPMDFCLDRGVVVLGRRGDGPLTVGMLDVSEALASEIARRTGREIRAVQLNAFEIRRAIGGVFQVGHDAQDGDLHLAPSKKIEFAAGQSPNRILEDLLSDAVRVRATDVHIETYQNDVDLRFRIDGVLRQVTTPLSPDNILRVVSRIKVLCQLDLVERRRAQDGRFSATYEGRRLDFRVSVIPGRFGQDVVMRVLDPSRFILDLDRLAMQLPMLARWRALAHYPGGLLLTTGPTGSGKTTTLYATVQDLRRTELKIVTVEDPVEYEFPKVNQKNVSAQMSFADYLRAFLRQNPDVILVGEIRDAETAEVAVRAATTGHLVLSTLHTRDALGAVARLRTLGIPDDSISNVLLGVLGQRLLRRLCESCSVEDAPVPSPFFDTPQPGLRRGAGCEACGGSGYRGLVGVYELFEPTSSQSAAIGEGVPVEDLREIALKDGYQPLCEDAREKVRAGLTSLEELSRKVEPPR